MAGMSWIRTLTLASLALVGCSKPKPSDQGAEIRDITPQIDAWEKANGAKVSPTVLRLRDGSCLDASRLPFPWSAMQDDGPLRLIIAAPRGEVGIEPARPLGDDKRPKATPAPLLISINGWSRPPGEDFGWRGPTPQTVDENIRIGVFKPIAIWPTNALRFQAFAGPGGENHYTDDRRFSQCRDYGSEYDRVRCTIVSQDGQYSFGGDLAQSNVPDLPTRLQKIGDAIEAMRGSCPA
jgi:hypothetical protein